MYHPKTRWIQSQIDEQRVEELVREAGVHPMIARILVLRGLNSQEQVARFLHVSTDDFHDPHQLRGMGKAVTRIRRALEDKEKIWIYGDYDADGVSSTSVMIETFRLLGQEVNYYIPNRFTEGYGLNRQAVELAAKRGVSLIITVDTGITAVEEAELARNLGVDLIITDHHEPPSVLPDALAVVNPKQPDCHYPHDTLAGVGVAFKLAHALLGRLPHELLQLAALGTIADLVPLVGENRIIAALGLKQMNERRHVGLNALLDVAGLADRQVTAGHIGFAIGPRINASGRLDTANPAVELLTSRDPERARTLAQQLDKLNLERQKLVDAITAEAISAVMADEGEHRYAVVVASAGWNVGVLGIVASRLVERFYRPAVVLSVDAATGEAKGSARSIDGFNLYRALSELKQWLIHFGGHEMAAGLTVAARDVAQFRKELNAIASTWLTDDDYIPATRVDVTCSVEDVKMDWVEQLPLLEPFGVGNRTPLFRVTGGKLQELRQIGRDRHHLKLTLAKGAAKLSAVAFQMGEAAEEIAPGVNLEAVGELQTNEWNGNRTVQLFVKDLSVPHLQVFDWRGKTVSDEMWRRLEQREVLFVCFDEQNVSWLHRHVSPEAASVQCVQGVDRVAVKSGVRHLIFVDFPFDVACYHHFIQSVPDLERVYFLGHADEAAYTVPKRHEFKRLYALLHRYKKVHSERALVQPSRLSPRAVSFMLEVFHELGFIERSGDEIRLKPNPVRRALETSTAFQNRKKREAVYQKFYYATSRELWEDIVKVRHGEPNPFSGGDTHELKRKDSHHRELSSAGGAF